MRGPRFARAVFAILALDAACGACVRATACPPPDAAKLRAEAISPVLPVVAEPAGITATIPAAPPPDAHRVIIAMSADTVQALSGSGASLYGFKAVSSSDRAGVPLVWFQTTRYSLRTAVTWQDRYQAYTATHTAAPSVTIDATASYDIALGQVLEVEQPTGTGVVLAGRSPGAISIHNQTTTPLTCGISQRQAGGAAPIALFPLYGKHLQLIVPREQVLLVFATAALAPGTPVTESPGLGILIDLSGADERTVAYDINTGWSWDGRPWAREVPPGADLVPLLIVPPSG